MRRAACDFSKPIKELSLTCWQSHWNAIYRNDDAAFRGKNVGRTHIKDNGIFPYKSIRILVADAVIVPQFREAQLINHEADDFFPSGCSADNDLLTRNDATAVWLSANADKTQRVRENLVLKDEPLQVFQGHRGSHFRCSEIEIHDIRGFASLGEFENRARIVVENYVMLDAANF